ncbi:helix-turn-helix domain-containing protein [Actinoplanes couchii]|uniref:Transcriptional regulator n=1 Tax=Actinoplanes couchii TaxID=403638 RepID=A0ABQ3XN29_9ACTN|nr:helix-turn-helix transcriptional regulator [Actinoplanes couchii]MDR6317912.1 transcriptional regulator with XRE-family HTH domain [Actinoplanes couchii]GID59899.1 transcriptional regulator [Actinoplanes couchii]
MISPYVRRRRLAAELKQLMQEHGYSAIRLASATRIPRQRISQIQNGHVGPSDAEMMRILNVLKVGQRRWDEIMTITRDCRERGWWEKYRDQIGPQQALYADLEAGARTITEYQLMIPGLLQIPAFTEVRVRANRGTRPEHFDPARALEARAFRQRVLDRAGGPTYEVIIDEQALLRPAAPPDILRDQLEHLVQVGRDRNRITIRILPLTTPLPGYVIPKSSFFTYRFPDPHDPTVVAVDTDHDDLVLTAPEATRHHLDLYQRIQQAALSPSASIDVLTTLMQQRPDR